MTTTAIAPQRDVTFDIMKGIGILLVITAHFFSWNHPILGRSITSFHMPMFFMVAGYFSKSFTSWSDTKFRIKKYASRLLPPALFTQVFLIIWACLMAAFNKGKWSTVIQLSLSLVWADPHGPITQWGQLYLGVVWFLIALFIAKSILLIISRLKTWAIPLSFVFSISAIVLYKWFPYSIWCISLGFTALPFVTIGWWFRAHTPSRIFQVICILCWIIAIQYSRLDMYGFIWTCYPLDVLGAIGGTFCMYHLCKLLDNYCNIIAKGFSILGTISLAIMCFHDIEINCHLGNHVMALFPVILPVWGKYVFRYLLTIVMAAISIKIPVLNRVFV